MKATKVWSDPAEACVNQALGDPWQSGTNLPDVLVRIEGLRPEPGVGEFAFSLEGVKHREIDWQLVRKGLLFEGDMPDDLVDDIAALVWKHDLVRILSERIKPA